MRGPVEVAPSERRPLLFSLVEMFLSCERVERLWLYYITFFVLPNAVLRAPRSLAVSICNRTQRGADFAY